MILLLLSLISKEELKVMHCNEFNSFFILSVLDNLFIYMTKLSEVSKNKLLILIL